MLKKIIAAVVVGLFAAGANASLLCTNAHGDQVEWWPGLPKPSIDLTPNKSFVCYIGGGDVALSYFNQRFPGMAVQGQSTLFFGDQARFIVSNIVRATRADYDDLVE